MKCLSRILILSILTSMVSIIAFAHDIAVKNSDGITIYYIWDINAKNLAVSFKDKLPTYDTYYGNVVIPDFVEYNGATYNVTAIGQKAFGASEKDLTVIIGNNVTYIGKNAFSCKGLTSVTIPWSVNKIAQSAFYKCTNLNRINRIIDLAVWCQMDPITYMDKDSNPMKYAKELHLYNSDGTEITNMVIPSGIKSLRYQAFQKCTGLTSVTIPNSVTYIDDSAFYGCSGLTSATIGNSVTSIGVAAFEKCSSLTSVTIPNSVTSIGIEAFWGCSALTSVVIPNSVISIGDYAFAYCSSLISIAIPNSVKSIDRGTFEGCSGLTSFSIPNNVTSIGDDAFKDCSGLTSVTIPNSVTSIGDFAFMGCSGLTSQAIPNSVTSIGEAAFEICSGLTSVTIPNSVISIGDYAFAGCDNLTSVTIFKETPIRIESNTFSNRANATLYVPKGSVSAYKATYYWKDFKNILEIGTYLPTHKLTYVVDGAEYKTYEMEEGATIIPEPAPTKEGYTFSGWSEIPETMPNHDVTIIGSFTINPTAKYKLIYKVDGEVYKTYEIEEGATITPEPAPTREGYTFSGWSEIPQVMPNHDVTVTGTFTKNATAKYKLTYKVDGEVYKTYEIEEGTTITPEPAPTKEGYTFSGWSEIPKTMPDHDVIVTGTFTKNATAKYKLTYKVDGEVYKTYEMEEGATITPEPAPTKEGYTFSGWSEIPQTMPDHDVTVTGTFTKNATAKYKLTYKVDGEVYKTYEMEEGATITPEPAPTKEGYTFSGWSEIPQTMPDHDVTVTGTFIPNTPVENVSYVDLGLPSGLLWATCNLGASSPEEVGGYYAWGETSPKTFFSQDNYQYKNSSISISNISGTEYDAARAIIGGPWRMPTKEELMELANNCTREETTLNGKACMKFTGPNGNSLYLPKGGFGDEGNGLSLNGYGLWSSTKSGSSTAYRAWEWYSISISNTWQGIPIRPVTSEKPTGSPTKFGDANGDGMVNAYDIIDIASHTMGKPTSTGTFNEKAADMNKDGVVNIADIVQIVNIIMGK